MAGKKQQAPKPIDEEAEEVEGEGWDNVADVDAESGEEAGQRMRDWRDVEKYREMRELRRLVGDEFDFTDVLGEIPIRTHQSARPDGKGKAAGALKGKPAPAMIQKNKPPLQQAKGKPVAGLHKAQPAAHKPQPAAPATKPKQAAVAHKPKATAAPKAKPAPAKKVSKPAKPAAKQKARKR